LVFDSGSRPGTFGTNKDGSLGKDGSLDDPDVPSIDEAMPNSEDITSQPSNVPFTNAAGVANEISDVSVVGGPVNGSACTQTLNALGSVDKTPQEGALHANVDHRVNNSQRIDQSIALHSMPEGVDQGLQVVANNANATGI
jgi:hypothetical protein